MKWTEKLGYCALFVAFCVWVAVFVASFRLNDRHKTAVITQEPGTICQLDGCTIFVTEEPIEPYGNNYVQFQDGNHNTVTIIAKDRSK